MDDAYNNIDDYDPKKVKKFDDMVQELFIRYRNLNVSFWGIIAQSCFLFPKEVRLDCTHYLIMKFHNKRELQRIVINHSEDINYKDL